MIGGFRTEQDEHLAIPQLFQQAGRQSLTSVRSEPVREAAEFLVRELVSQAVDISSRVFTRV
jgi:hypothetical protein